MELKDYIIGFLVFSLFLSIMFGSLSYMYSSKPGSYNLDLGDQEQEMQEYLELSNSTYSTYSNQAFEVQRTSPGGNETADNPEDASSLEQDISTWKILWSIPSTLGQTGKVISLAGKTFGKYVPNKIFAIILISIILTVTFLIISAVRKYSVR